MFSTLLTSGMPLFESITIFCGTADIPQNIPIIQLNMGNIRKTILCEILSVPHNVVMDLNDVMWGIDMSINQHSMSK